MIGWEPCLGFEGPWHVSVHHTDTSLCGIRVAKVDRYVKRDPHRVEDYGGARCRKCWTEWGLMTAASYARQAQDEAALAEHKG